MEEVDAAVEPVSAGPSQCQWSPCGSQPVDSVGLGIVDEVSVTEEMAVEAGPSQCLYERGVVRRARGAVQCMAQ